MINFVNLSKIEIEETYNLIKKFHEKYLLQFSVKLPKLKNVDGGFTKDALALVYLAQNYPKTKAVSKEELLSTSKIVTLHLVPGETTRGIINAQTLSLMRNDALLVNTSRSTLIKTADLVEALKIGKPGMAALDVYDDEPLPLNDPLRQLNNLLMTPHLGFVAQPVYQRLSRGTVMAIEAWLKGDPLVNIVKK
jgi:phosphoglycerate dehydrogenase-like enzyme